MEVPIYYSYKTFLKTWKDDFKEYQETYPNATERFFLDEVKSLLESEDYQLLINEKFQLLKYNKKTSDASDEIVGIYRLEDSLNKRLNNILKNQNVDNLFRPQDDFPYFILQEIIERYPSNIWDIGTEEDYIYIDLKFLKSIMFTVEYDYCLRNGQGIKFNRNKIKDFKYSVSQILNYIDEFSNEPTTELQEPEPTTSLIQQYTPIKTNITQTELVELVKALIENGTIQGTQKDLINSFADFFGIEVKNQNQIIQNIKNRNNGGETLFLDKLKEVLKTL